MNENPEEVKLKTANQFLNGKLKLHYFDGKKNTRHLVTVNLTCEFSS